MPEKEKEKECGNHNSYYQHKLYRRILISLLTLTLLLLFIILLIYLILRPSKPKFLLQDASIYHLNLSSLLLLSSNLQITLSSRNPNGRVGIYYDRLDAFAEYKREQISAPTALPAGYQGHGDVTVWSPFLSAVAVPVSLYLVDAIGEDEAAGLMLIYVRIVGKLRWKVGSWVSAPYHLDVSCPAFFTVAAAADDDDDDDAGGVAAFRFQQINACTVGV